VYVCPISSPFNYTPSLYQVETKRGVTGFAETEERLQKVSQQKAEVDSVKGKTLEEISQV